MEDNDSWDRELIRSPFYGTNSIDLAPFSYPPPSYASLLDLNCIIASRFREINRFTTAVKEDQQLLSNIIKKSGVFIYFLLFQ